MDCTVCIAGLYCNAEGLPFPITCPAVSINVIFNSLKLRIEYIKTKYNNTPLKSLAVYNWPACKEHLRK